MYRKCRASSPNSIPSPDVYLWVQTAFWNGKDMLTSTIDDFNCRTAIIGSWIDNAIYSVMKLQHYLPGWLLGTFFEPSHCLRRFFVCPSLDFDFSKYCFRAIAVLAALFGGQFMNIDFSRCCFRAVKVPPAPQSCQFTITAIVSGRISKVIALAVDNYCYSNDCISN